MRERYGSAALRAGKAIAAVLAAASLSGPGCGLARKENRVALNALDRAADNTWMESRAGVVAALPLTVPAGTAALLVDAGVALPVRSAPQAFCDTYADIWKDPQGSDFRQAVLFLPKVVGSALYFPSDFAFSWLFRQRFDGCRRAGW